MGPAPSFSEIAAGAAVFLLVAFGGIPLTKTLGLGSLVYWLTVTAWSGIAGLAGFAVATSLRIRSPAAFGVRRTSWRWLAVGAGGPVALVLTLLFIAVLTPIGEEVLFRGVVANALLRYGTILVVPGRRRRVRGRPRPQPRGGHRRDRRRDQCRAVPSQQVDLAGVVAHAVNDLGTGVGILIAAIS